MPLNSKIEFENLCLGTHNKTHNKTSKRNGPKFLEKKQTNQKPSNDEKKKKPKTFNLKGRRSLMKMPRPKLKKYLFHCR